MFRGEAPEVKEGYKKGQVPLLCTCTVRDRWGALRHVEVRGYPCLVCTMIRMCVSRGRHLASQDKPRAFSLPTQAPVSHGDHPHEVPPSPWSPRARSRRLIYARHFRVHSEPLWRVHMVP